MIKTVKKIAIITIYDMNNYGNRLQNYAVQEVLKAKGFEVETIKYSIDYTLSIVKEGKRLNCFREFNERINFAPDSYTMSQNSEIPVDFDQIYDYVVIGSDQIWNYEFQALFSDKVFGGFVSKEKRVAFSASIGVEYLPTIPERYEAIKKYLQDMSGISVREFAGKEIIKKLSGRDDVEVLVDPTMLITAEEWSKISKKPEWIEKDEKYILKGFLGEDQEVNEKLEKYAKEHGYKVIDIYNSNSPYYGIGPAEFIYLEQNAKLVITDSYHGSVFALLFEKPLLVYKRKDADEKEMYSRMKTLIEKFNLQNIEYNGEIDDKRIFINNINEQLEYERKLAKDYLNKYLKNN